MMAIRIILNRLRINKGFILMPGDIEIHINHNKLDNLLTKAETLKLLLDSGIYYKRAIKTIDLFSDPEQTALESKERMDFLYPIKAEQKETENDIK